MRTHSFILAVHLNKLCYYDVFLVLFLSVGGFDFLIWSCLLCFKCDPNAFSASHKAFSVATVFERSYKKLTLTLLPSQHYFSGRKCDDSLRHRLLSLQRNSYHLKLTKWMMQPPLKNLCLQLKTQLCSSVFWWEILRFYFTQWANILLNLAGATLNLHMHAFRVWKWKPCYLESRE